MLEIWRPIDGFDGRYDVSNLCRVRRNPFIDRSGSRQTERILSQSAGNGYPTVFISFNQQKHALYVHRLLAIAFIPNPHNLPEVNHLDGNNLNNALTNLEWTDTKGNALHARRIGLKRQKLTPDDVRAIRAGYRWRKRTSALAAKFGITKEQVRNVVSRKHHQWVD